MIGRVRITITYLASKADGENYTKVIKIMRNKRMIMMIDDLITMVVMMMGTITPPCAENAKINVTDELYFGTYILCSYLPLSKAAKGAQGGPQQYETFERKHSPTDISKRLWSSEK